MSHLPSGTVTFLMTDLVGSTQMWERDPVGMRTATRTLDATAREVVGEHHGELVKARGEGDSIFAVFQRASDAVSAALALQQASMSQGFAIRMAVHTGETELLDDDYYGPVVNRCARLRGIAHGGQILLSQAAAQLSSDSLPDGATLKDLGHHRLRDLMRPERVSELVHESLPARSEPPRSLDQHPHNLPVQLTSFIGREREIREVVGALGSSRVVTLVGAGGSGKTRLSLMVAAEVQEQFPDGVWQIDLTPVRDPLLIPKTVTSALKLGEGSHRDPTTVLLEELAPLRTLLVVDNCEHLIEHTALLLSSLLRACPSLSVLATSREPLKISGEKVYRVPPLELPVPGVEYAADEVAAFEACRLFLDRAASRVSSFRITEGNKAAVSTLCRRLDGIPLAIEHVASNMTVLSPQRVLDRWKEGFPVLATDQRDGIERHLTLRASIDWSFGMLSSAEQEMFARVSAFVSPFTLEAAEAVCAGDGIDSSDVLSLLQTLVDKCLVLTDVEDEQCYFWLLETMRAYGRERATSDAPGEAFIAWHVRAAEEADPEFVGARQVEFMRLIERQYGNFRLALQAAEACDPESLLRLAHGLRRFWIWRGQLSEGRSWIEAALRGKPPESALEARLYNALGAILGKQSLHEQSAAAYEQSLKYWQAVGDSRQAATVWHNLGISAIGRQDLELARAHFLESLRIHQDAGDEREVALALLNLGMVEVDLGRPHDAVPILTEATELLAASGNTAISASAQCDLAEAYRRCGQAAEAAAALDTSFQLFRQSKDQTSMTFALVCLSRLLHDLGEFDQAVLLALCAEHLAQVAGAQLNKEHRAYVAGVREEARERLGRAATAKVEAKSRGMTTEAAAEYALTTLGKLTFAESLP